MEIALGVMAIVVMVALFRPRKKLAPAGGFVAVPVRAVRISAIKVLFGLMKSVILYAVYIGGTGLYLASHPPFWVEWWSVAMLIDIIALIAAAGLGLPGEYRAYQQNKPKNGGHSAMDYLVGIVLSIVLVTGIGLHIVILASAPGWTFAS